MKAPWLGPLFAAALPLATAFPAVADQPASYQALLTPLLKAGTDIVGQPLAYPEGAPVITAAIVTLPPGRETGWHVHEVPLFVHILEGAITVDYGEKGIKVYAAGDREAGTRPAIAGTRPAIAGGVTRAARSRGRGPHSGRRRATS